VVGATAVLLTVSTVGRDPFAAGSIGPRLGVPAYWSPATAVGAEQFKLLADAAGTVNLVIINGPASAAPVPFDTPTADTIRRLRRAGVTVLGYVDSGYLGQTGLTTTRVRAGSTDIADWVSQIRGDVADWYELYGRYGLGGLFIDQTLSSCGSNDEYVAAYRNALHDVRRESPGAMVALNPGSGADECYMQIADAMVIFENTYDLYQEWAPPSWVSRYPTEQFWHLIYDAPTEATLSDVVHSARRRHAGHVYVTDQPWSATRSQWDSLPTYWQQELCRIAAETTSC
jgi:Spherulation-specific family 4